MGKKLLRPLAGAIVLLAATVMNARAGNYCVAAPNSTGVGAVIDSQGSRSIAANHEVPLFWAPSM